VGEREFRLTFYSVLWNAGLLAGFERVQDTLVLSESGDESTGHAHVDFLDANWNVVFSSNNETNGTRLEMPAGLAAQLPEIRQLVAVWEVKAWPVG
jgi:urease beta subunit